MLILSNNKNKQIKEILVVVFWKKTQYTIQTLSTTLAGLNVIASLRKDGKRCVETANAGTWIPCSSSIHCPVPVRSVFVVIIWPAG